MLFTIIFGSLVLGGIGYGAFFHENPKPEPLPNTVAPVAVDTCHIKQPFVTMMGRPVQPAGKMYIDCTESILRRIEAGTPPTPTPKPEKIDRGDLKSRF